jgi:uncharacterized protein HemY
VVDVPLREPTQGVHGVTSTNRFRSLFGAARAAELAGDAAKARAFYTRLAALCEQADTERPELTRARQYLASHR